MGEYNRYLAFDGFRAYFVLLTFLVHGIGNIPGFGQQNLWGQFLGWLQLSNYGVYGFFILSGFLIGRMWLKTNRPKYLSFLWQRFLRIYPAFLASIVITACVGIYYTGYMSWGWDTKILIQNLLFLNGWFVIGEIPSYNFVTWSLFLEFVFYFVAPVIVWRMKLVDSYTGKLFIAFGCIFLVATIMSLKAPFYLFFAGMALSLFKDEDITNAIKPVPEYAVIILYVVSTTAYSLMFISSETFTFVFMITCTMLMAKANYNDGLLSKIFAHPWLCMLGKISYSFYLMHATVIIAFFYTKNTYFPELIGRKLAILSLVIALILTVIISAMLWFLTERWYFARKRAQTNATQT